MNIEEQVDAINTRMRRNRMDQYKPPYQTWEGIQITRALKAKDCIRLHLEQGHKVTAGYFCTSVRGYHTHFVFWKEYAVDESALNLETHL